MKHIALKDMGTTGLISFVVNGSNRMRGARMGKARRIINARHNSWEAHIAFTKACNAAVDRMRMAEARKNLIAQYANMVAEDPHPCCHGHFNCAIRPGGPCSDEMLTKSTPSSEAA